MSVEIDNFKTGVSSDITTKTAPRSISATIVGGKFASLADIVEAFRAGLRTDMTTAQADIITAQEGVDAINVILGDVGGDADAAVNKLREALTILQNFSEGADVNAMIANKVDKVTGSSLLSDTEIARLATLANYTHPTGDGNLHVPATSTVNADKALVAGATAGSASWVSLAIAHISGLSSTLAAKADLVAGTLPVSQLPPTIPLANIEEDLLLPKFVSSQFEDNGSGLIQIKSSVLSSGSTDNNTYFKSKRLGLWMFNADTTTRQSFGVPISITGTANAMSYTPSGTWVQQQNRYGQDSAATANSVCSLRNGNYNWALVTGFKFFYKFLFDDAATVAGAYAFIGFTANTADLSASATIASNLNIIGIGYDAGDTNLSIYTNNGTGTATKIDLGSGYPATTRNTDVYEVTLEAAAGATTVNYTVKRFSNTTGAQVGTTASGTTSTDVPATTQKLTIHASRMNGATALAVTLTHFGMVIEY